MSLPLLTPTRTPLSSRRRRSRRSSRRYSCFDLGGDSIGKSSPASTTNSATKWPDVGDAPLLARYAGDRLSARAAISNGSKHREPTVIVLAVIFLIYPLELLHDRKADERSQLCRNRCRSRSASASRRPRELTHPEPLKSKPCAHKRHILGTGPSASASELAGRPRPSMSGRRRPRTRAPRGRRWSHYISRRETWSKLSLLSSSTPPAGSGGWMACRECDGPSAGPTAEGAHRTLGVAPSCPLATRMAPVCNPTIDLVVPPSTVRPRRRPTLEALRTATTRG